MLASLSQRSRSANGVASQQQPAGGPGGPGDLCDGSGERASFAYFLHEHGGNKTVWWTRIIASGASLASFFYMDMLWHRA